jgi:WD40 repeat protein
VAFSPDGSLLAVGTSPVVVLDAESFDVAATLDGTGGAVAFASDGATLAADAGGTVRLYATTTWSVVGSVEHTVPGPRDRVWQISFSAMDATLVTASGQVGFGSPHGDIKVWSVPDRALARTLDCTALSVTVSAEYVIGACWNTVEAWAANDLSPITTLETEADAIGMGVALSPDGATLAVGEFMRGVRLFRTADWTEVGVLTAPDGGPTAKAVAWSPDGARLVAVGWDDPAVFVWNTEAF